MENLGDTSANELEQVLLRDMAYLPGNMVDDESTVFVRGIIVLNLLDGVV